jgi:SNF2 family DNA or RNA helicase
VAGTHRSLSVPVTPQALKRFLDAPRKDWRWFKDLTDDQIWDRWERLPVAPPIWTKLKQHQRITMLLGIKLRRLAIWGDTGVGKTLISIALAKYFERAKLLRTVLVLVPTTIVKGEWEDEILKHSPSTDYLVLRGSSEDKWRDLERRKPLLIIETFDGLSWLLCKLVKKKKGRGQRLVPDPKRIKRMQSIVKGLVLDESSEVANRDALPFRMCRQLEKTAEIVFLLSATPFGRDPISLWAQMYLIDKGATLGATKSIFRAAFFKEKFNGFQTEYKFDIRKWPDLNRMLANASIRYKANAADLPPVSLIPKYASLPDEQQGYADKTRKLIIEAKEKGSYHETRNGFLRMRQLSSGFLGYFDDEAGDRAQVEFDDNPKLEMLLDLIEKVCDEHKIVVFHHFNYSGYMIERELKKLGIDHGRLWGGTKDPDPIKRAFNTSKTMRVVLLSVSYGGMGLNLQAASYGPFFESPVSAILRTQCERRIERQYSKHERVFLYDLLMRGTYDEKIRKFHKEGGDLLKAILDGKEPV